MIFMTVEAAEYGKIFMDRLGSGAFLTTSDGTKANTMTVSWGNLGIMWKSPIVTVMVRQTRYSKENLNKVKAFTLSVPMDDTYAAALAICGSKSGRDTDKYAATGLTTAAPQTGIVPVIAGAGLLHFECTVVYERLMDVSALSDDLQTAWYGKDTAHTIYVGKINAVYKK
jgi:flavin reductase (DIM6/NTAB) family NADH-FMN oxidoreductase RutF